MLIKINIYRMKGNYFVNNSVDYSLKIKFKIRLTKLNKFCYSDSLKFCFLFFENKKHY